MEKTAKLNGKELRLASSLFTIISYRNIFGTELFDDVEKLDKEVDSEVTFTDVLYVDGKAGTPYVDGAKVVCSVEKQGKAKKIVVFKFRPKKKYRNTQGHRQPYTKLVVKKISVK